MQANNPTTALCPGMRCSRVFNILRTCAGVPGVGSTLNAVRQELDALDHFGNNY